MAKEPLREEKETKMVDVIMLKHKNPEAEKKCVKNIIENTDYPFKLTVYDNRVNGKNISKIWNKLIKESTCDYICILDSDLYVPKKWLTKMMNSMTGDIKVVVPVMDNTSCKQQKYKAPSKGTEKVDSVLAGQIVLYDKSIFDEIGYFNERYLLYGQDTEWALKFLLKDGRGIIRKDVFCIHEGSSSVSKIQDEYPALIEREYAHKVYFEEASKMTNISKYLENVTL